MTLPIAHGQRSTSASASATHLPTRNNLCLCEKLQHPKPRSNTTIRPRHPLKPQCFRGLQFYTKNALGVFAIIIGMKPETIPMTQAIRTLKAAKADFELMTYDFELHGGTIQCATELGIDHHATIKTIILEDETKKPFVCLMHGDREISTKNLARVRGVKTVQTCEPETADRHSGYHVGGTSPFGTRKRMKVYVESTIFDLPRIYINAGHRGICAAMSPDVLEKVLPDTQRVSVAIS